MSLLRAALVSAVLLSTSSLGAPKSYQVTGEVVELSDEVITVLKGKEKFEIARADVKAEGELKKGSKVTVEYKMTATTITVKDGKGK